MQQDLLPGGIPRYFLYEGAGETIDLDFLHVEQIRERSGRHDWIIRAHSHPDHVQILFVEHEGGTIRIEDCDHQIPTGALLVIPSAMVHEIRFRPGTDGIVITAANVFAAQIAGGEARFLDLLSTPRVFPLGPQDPLDCAAIFGSVLREYTWSAAGRKAAIRADFLRLLVALLRLQSDHAQAGDTVNDRDYAVLARYRALIEVHFRTERSMDFYASEVGVTAQRLNQACRNRAGRTASELLHERLVIEAKRALLYLELSVAEVGYSLGFEDPAYFSRFFTQRVGCPPGAFRRLRTEGGDGAQMVQ